MGILIGVIFVFGVGGFIALIVWTEKRREEKKRQAYLKRRAYLLNKYDNDETVADRIMAGTLWQGATEDMVIDMLGTPATIDEKVFKTKTRRTYKYYQVAKNRFALKVKLENGVVVGWDAPK